MPLFTEDQKSAIRHYCGYTVGYHNDVWVAVNGGIANVERNDAYAYTHIVAPLTDTPPGILAKLEQIETDLFTARGRFKANVVGPITLNRGEPAQLANEGRRLASKLCQFIGIAKERDVFASGQDTGDAHRGWPSIRGPGNYVGK